jgi:hypothetical protein
MRKVICVIMLIGLLAISGTALGEGLTIFGITMGKSISENNIPECGISSLPKKDPNHTTPEVYVNNTSNCYKLKCFSYNNTCFALLQLDLSYNPDIYLNGQLPKDKIRDEPIEEIQFNFNNDYYKEVFESLVNKFGKPSKCKQTIVSNKMGATFENEACMWLINSNQILLYKMMGKVDEGFLTIRTAKQIKKYKEERNKKQSSDNSKF